MCYTDVCNVLAINVQCYLMPNKMYVMLCYESNHAPCKQNFFGYIGIILSIRLYVFLCKCLVSATPSEQTNQY